jgi:hypothetical protein
MKRILKKLLKKISSSEQIALADVKEKTKTPTYKKIFTSIDNKAVTVLYHEWARLNKFKINKIEKYISSTHSKNINFREISKILYGQGK